MLNQRDVSEKAIKANAFLKEKLNQLASANEKLQTEKKFSEKENINAAFKYKSEIVALEDAAISNKNAAAERDRYKRQAEVSQDKLYDVTAEARLQSERIRDLEKELKMLNKSHKEVMEELTDQQQVERMAMQKVHRLNRELTGEVKTAKTEISFLQKQKKELDRLLKASKLQSQKESQKSGKLAIAIVKLEKNVRRLEIQVQRSQSAEL